MKKIESGRVNMTQTTIQYCEQHAAIIATILAFPPLVLSVKAKLVLINQLNQLTMAGTGGVTADTRLVRTATMEIAFKCSSALKSYAISTDNNTLLEEVDYSESELKRLKRDVFDDVCQAIHDLADTNIAVAGSHGYTAADVTALDTAITIYRTVQQNPRQARIAIKSANRQIEELVRDMVNKNLKGQMDTMVRTLKKTHPNFVSEYFDARKIINLPTNTTRLTGLTSENTTGGPLDGVTARLYAIGGGTPLYETLSAADGTYSITAISPGDYRLEYSKEGYETVVKVLVHFSPGQHVVQNPFLTAIP